MNKLLFLFYAYYYAIHFTVKTDLFINTFYQNFKVWFLHQRSII